MAMMAYYTSSHHTQADMELSALQSQRLEESPEMANLGDGHRCKRFPCPICNQGRSHQIMLPFISQVDAVQPPQGRGLSAAPVHVLGDGGHTCRRFPCPICQTGRRMAATLEVQ